MSVVGFDIGNLNCFIAVARAGGIELVTNEQSERCSSAFVSFTENQRLTASAAKNQMVTNARNTVSNIKRFIGRKFDDPFVQHEIALAPFNVIKQEDGSVGIKVRYLNEEEVFAPEQILAMLLTSLKSIAEYNLGKPVQDCVISVPSYFTDYQRRALLTTSKIAGLNCLRLLNETTAVALSYGLFKKDLPSAEEKARNVVLVDVGHSACQVSICAFRKGKIKVLSTANDPLLGGRDFDYILRDHFSAEFLKKYKLNVQSKVRPWLRLLTESEKMKKLMSANATDLPLNIECFMEDKDVSARINRSTMEELSKGILERLQITLEDALGGSGLSAADIHSVELVGGSTRIPAIRNVVQNVFKTELFTTLNADEAVAKGCAIQCAMLSPTFKVRDIEVDDVTPYPIHLSWKAQSGDEDCEMEIFCKGHSFPATKMLTLKRKEPLELFAYYKTESNVPHTELSIGRFLISGITPTSTGEAAKIKVRVRLNIHGVLTVSNASMVEELPTPPPSPETNEKETPAEPMEAQPSDGADATAKENGIVPNVENKNEDEPMTTDKEADSSSNQQKEKAGENSESKQTEGEKKPEETQKKSKKRKITTDLTVDSFVPELNDKQINKLVEKEWEMIMQVKLEKERHDALNAVEEYVYAMRDRIYSVYEAYILDEDREKFSALLSETEDWLYGDGEGQRKDVYVKKLEELKKFGQPVVDRCTLHSEVPAAFESFGHSFMHFRKIMDLFHKKDENYSHIEKAEMEKVQKKIDEKMSWLNSKMVEFQNTPKHVKPGITPSDIKSAKKELEDFCNPIVTKAKPKVEPPPTNGTKDSAGENNKNGKSGDQKKEESAKSEQGKSATPEAEQAGKKEEDTTMEVD